MRVFIAKTSLYVKRLIFSISEYGLAEATTGISVGSQPGEQVPTTRSSVFDESSHFSSTMSMSVISSTYPGSSYASPLLNKRRITRRVSTLRRGSKDRGLNVLDTPTTYTDTLTTYSDTPTAHVGATSVRVRKTSLENTEKKQGIKKSKSCPADATDSGDEPSPFERKSSFKSRLFGSRGRNKTPEGSKGTEDCSSETLNESNDSLSSSKSGKQGQSNDSKNSKGGKSGQNNDSTNSKGSKSSKRKTLLGRFTSSRPLSTIEVRESSSKENVHQRTKSDASVVKKCIDAGTTSPVLPQAGGIVLENSPSNSGYSTVVSSMISKTWYSYVQVW